MENQIEILKSLIKDLQNEKINTIYCLSNYLLTGEPIYLPKSLRKYDRELDRSVILEYFTIKFIDEL